MAHSRPRSRRTCLQLAVAATTPRTLYASTFLTGLEVSRDGGARWKHADEANGLDEKWIRRVVLPPTNATLAYAIGNSGLWLTTDAGGTWAPLGAGHDGVMSVAFDPATAAPLYVGCWNSISKSEDAGSSWARVLAMLSARGEVDWRGNSGATPVEGEEEPKAIRLFS